MSGAEAARAKISGAEAARGLEDKASHIFTRTHIKAIQTYCVQVQPRLRPNTAAQAYTRAHHAVFRTLIDTRGTAFTPPDTSRPASEKSCRVAAGAGGAASPWAGGAASSQAADQGFFRLKQRILALQLELKQRRLRFVDAIFGLKRRILRLQLRLVYAAFRFVDAIFGLKRRILRLQLRLVYAAFRFERGVFDPDLRPQLRELSLRLQQLLSHRPRLLQPLSARLLLHEGPHALVGHGGGAIAERWLPLLEYTCCECFLCWQPLRGALGGSDFVKSKFHR